MKSSLLYLGLLLTLLLISCNESNFKGTAKTTLVKPKPEEILVKPPLCIDQGKSTLAPNIAFIVDNSASNGSAGMTTDCPGQQNSYNGVYCSQPTMRENAIKSVVSSLATVMNSESNNPAAVSNIAVSMYPRTGAGIFSLYDRWIPVSQLEQNTLDQMLEFTRYPDGDTPLLTGIQAANRLKQTAQGNGRRTIFVFISDGFPNDAYVNNVLNSARQLNASSEVFVLSNTNGSNYDARRADLIDVMAPRWSNGRSYAIPSMTSTQYYNIMLGESENDGVMNELADKHFVVERAADMPSVLKHIINTSGGIQCVDPK